MLYTNNQILERDGLTKRTYFKSWKKRLRVAPLLRTRLSFEKDQLRTSDEKGLDFDFEPNQVQVKSTGFGLRSSRFRPRSGRTRLGPGQAG